MYERLAIKDIHRVRDRKRLATCLRFGPRFLYSTGQEYKGGPGTSVPALTCYDGQNLPAPGQKCTFGLIQAAQGRGDFQVLAERNCWALPVHVRSDVAAGLRALNAAIEKTLA